MSALRWKSDLNKIVITSNFEHRGWKVASDDDWNVFWASVATVQQIFAKGSLIKLQPGQLINHFPNHYELTRKDLLVKNINRYRRRMRKAGHTVPNIIPATFVLPQDYALFVEEFRKQPGSSTFILKPAGKSQGKGIFLINKLSQLLQHPAVGATADTAAMRPAAPAVFLLSGTPQAIRDHQAAQAPVRPALQDYVVSRYIDNPLLLFGGNKFDLRLYVLVPSYQPLVAYLASLGFARFSNVRYTREVAELDNQFVHLTNVAIQKSGGEAYNSSHGNKWPLADLRLHLEATRGHAATAQLFADIQALVVHTLKAVQPVIISDKHCFELYGFDVIIDDNLQPWLIEVNASPSMTSTTTADRLLKWQVIHDALSIIIPQVNKPSNSTPSGTAPGSGCLNPNTSQLKEAAQQQQRPYPEVSGCMQLIHHDARDPANKGKQRTANAGAVKGSTAAAAVPAKHVVLHG